MINKNVRSYKQRNWKWSPKNNTLLHYRIAADCIECLLYKTNFELYSDLQVRIFTYFRLVPCWGVFNIICCSNSEINHQPCNIRCRTASWNSQNKRWYRWWWWIWYLVQWLRTQNLQCCWIDLYDSSWYQKHLDYNKFSKMVYNWSRLKYNVHGIIRLLWISL